MRRPLGRPNLWPLYYALRDARLGAGRNLVAAVSAVLVAAFAVSLAALVFLGSDATRSAARLLREQAAMRVVLTEPSEATSPAGRAEAVARRIRALPGVASARVVPPEETLAALEEAFGGTVDLGRLFPENPFPPSVAVSLTDPDEAGALAARIARWPEVDEVVYGQKYLPAVLGLADFLRRAGLASVVGFALLGLAVTVVTWQLAVLSRLAEVRVKAWMGVSPWALAGQFAAEGALLGLAGGALAAMGLILVVHRVELALATLLPWPLAPPRFGPLVVLCLASGTALGAAGASLALARLARREGVFR